MKINGHLLHKMLVSAANALDNKQIEINNMNVFPVPDGDTGVNMTLTFSPVREMKDSDAVSDLAKQAASLILRAARPYKLDLGIEHREKLHGTSPEVRILKKLNLFHIVLDLYCRSHEIDQELEIINPLKGTYSLTRSH